MIQPGLKKHIHDRRDYDYFKTKRLQGIVPAFPKELNIDDRLWMPDQNAGFPMFVPTVPPQPYGCTNVTTCDMLGTEDGVLYNPQDVENYTHANANGGIDLRTAAKAGVALHGKDHPAFFWVKPDIKQGGYTDWFDAIRLAIVIGLNEKRKVSIGTSWHSGFENVGKDGLISDSMLTTPVVGGHDWAGVGWVEKDETRLICKSWQGESYGDVGYCYFTRNQFNKLMDEWATSAFVYDKLLPGEQPIVISSTTKQWLVSFFTQLIAKIGL